MLKINWIFLIHKVEFYYIYIYIYIYIHTHLLVKLRICWLYPLQCSKTFPQERMACVWRWKREREAKKQKQKTNRAIPKRGNLSLELSYLLNPPPGDTVSNRLSNCSPTTPFSLSISIPQGQKSSESTLAMPFFYGWQSMLVTHGQYA